MRYHGQKTNGLFPNTPAPPTRCAADYSAASDAASFSSVFRVGRPSRITPCSSSASSSAAPSLLRTVPSPHRTDRERFPASYAVSAPHTSSSGSAINASPFSSSSYCSSSSAAPTISAYCSSAAATCCSAASPAAPAATARAGSSAAAAT